MRVLSPGGACGILLVVSAAALACRLNASVPQVVTPSPLPVAGEKTTAPLTAPASTATPPPPPTCSPSPSVEPTGTVVPSVTFEPTLAPIAFRGPAVSYNGISFALDPALGDGVFDRTEPDSLVYLKLSLAPEGDCRDVGCVTVYPVASYREGVPFGAEVIDGLLAAVETGSDETFPAVMAHILLRAKTRHVQFQNGAGMRAIVMKGQDTVYANNASIVYEFHGLTDDGRYYVAATFPIDAPMLLNGCCHPAENTNEAAIPAPALPDDDAEAGVLIREYNREAQRQLDALDEPGFTPSLALLDELVTSLLIRPAKESGSAARDGVGVLQVDIDYRGTWYRETFSYTREGENIAHFVLVVPESQVDRATADQVFSSIDFSSAPGSLSIREGREELTWALAHVNSAPGARFRGHFQPGTYYAAAAFVAAPLSRKEAGQAADGTLYAGMTGGGASTDYWRIEIEPGENAVTLSLTDGDGWACPWLYVHNGRSFERRTEVLRHVRGRQHERTEVSPIGVVEIVDGSITLMVAEEKDEITFIDELYVIVEGVEVRAEATSRAAVRAAERDQDYVVIASGTSREFRFRLPASLAGRERAAATVVVSGFYVPLERCDPSLDAMATCGARKEADGRCTIE